MQFPKRQGSIPLLVSHENYFKFANLIRTLDITGYLDIQIVDQDIIGSIKIPEAIQNMVIESNTPLNEMINIILRDFVIRMNEGSSKYEKGILKRLNDVPADILDLKTKLKLICYLNSEPKKDK